MSLAAIDPVELPSVERHALGSSAVIAARLDRLPSCWLLWRSVILISIGAFFELYELFCTPQIIAGLIKNGVISQTSGGLFGLGGIATFVSSLFGGMFVSTLLFGFISDRLGRRSVFTYSLLWYSAATVMMAFQSDPFWINCCRFITGIGLGIELVTVDAYLSELVPAHMRGRAFAINQFLSYLAVPVAAFLGWQLIPIAPLGFDGWRWITLIGATGAIVVWFIRLRLPESPRWLAGRGRADEAERLVSIMETDVVRTTGSPLLAPEVRDVVSGTGRFSELWSGQYAMRTSMMLVFMIAASIGLYGFANWVPTFLVTNGITLTKSLGYTLGISCVIPFGPLLIMPVADRIERKWQIVGSAAVVAAAGMLFAATRDGFVIILCGALVNLGTSAMSQAFHAYQAEIYPTRIRALGIGFVYSASRLSGAMSGFVIAYALAKGGVGAALGTIAASMVIVMLVIGLLGPRTAGQSLEDISN